MRTSRFHPLPQYRMQSFYGPYRPQSSGVIRALLFAFAAGLLLAHGCALTT
jgi:hypothetical protein